MQIYNQHITWQQLNSCSHVDVITDLLKFKLSKEWKNGDFFNVAGLSKEKNAENAVYWDFPTQSQKKRENITIAFLWVKMSCLGE